MVKRLSKYGLIHFKPSEASLEALGYTNLGPDSGFWLIESPYDRTRFRAEIPGCRCMNDSKPRCKGWHRKKIEKIAKTADSNYVELPPVVSDFALVPMLIVESMTWAITEEYQGVAWKDSLLPYDGDPFPAWKVQTTRDELFEHQTWMKKKSFATESDKEREQRLKQTLMDAEYQLGDTHEYLIRDLKKTALDIREEQEKR